MGVDQRASGRALSQAILPLSRERDDLVERCLRGDAAAFRTVVERHGRAVQGTLVRILGPRRDLEDLVQQVFLELARSLPRFRGDASLGTFVVAIAANVARRTLERGPRPSYALDTEALSAGDDPEARADARQLLVRMFLLLDRLTPAKRVAFVLHAVEGRDIREVATMVGANEPTVRARVTAARRELESLLGRSS